MSKTYFNAFNESEFYCITFRFYGHATGERRWGCGAACVCVKMHSTQNVDKLVKTLHEVGKTGDKAETNRSFSYRKKSHLKCQMWCVFLGLCPLRFPSLPTPRSGKDISAGILHKFGFQCRTRNRRREKGWGCRGMQGDAAPKCMLDFWIFGLLSSFAGFWAFDYLCQIHLTRNLSYILEPRQGDSGDGDMFSATATTTKAFSHKGPPIRGRHRRRTRRLSEHSMSAKCTCSSPRML